MREEEEGKNGWWKGGGKKERKERQWGKTGERKTLQKMKMKRHNNKEA